MRADVYEPWHFREWEGRDLECEAVGFTLFDTHGSIHAILIVYQTPGGPDYPGNRGEVWGSFDSLQPVPPLAHRYAVKLREIVREVGIARLHARPDREVPNAEKWLDRLGFVPGPDDVWRLDL